MTLYIAFDKLKNGHRLRSVARIFYTKEKMGKMMQFRVPSGSAPELLTLFMLSVNCEAGLSGLLAGARFLNLSDKFIL